ncbi:MAG: hypothetical protein ACKORF_01625 [Micrococcales bacterium]
MTKTQKMLALAIVFAISITSMSAPAAEAAKCRNAGTKSNGIKVGSQVDGDLLTICASKKLIKQFALKVTVKPKATAKPSMPTKVKPLPTAKKAVVKKIPLAKPKSRVKVTRRVKNNSGLALFRPAKPLASRLPLGQVAVSEEVSLAVRKQTTDGFTYLLGRLVRVRFVPNRAEWTLGDQSQAIGFSTQHAYATSGVYLASARVRFRVSYRLSGGEWIRDPDQIWLSAKPLQIPVEVSLTPGKQSRTVLVLTH